MLFSRLEKGNYEKEEIKFLLNGESESLQEAKQKNLLQGDLFGRKGKGASIPQAWDCES